MIPSKPETGLGFDQEIPHHSTFSKNRHGRFQESNLFQGIFEEIVARCVEAGLVNGEHRHLPSQEAESHEVRFLCW
jgi:transposase